MPAYLQPAVNAIVVMAPTLHRIMMKVGANATAAKMLPGTFVILDTTTNEVKEAGAAAHGVLGLIDVDATHDIDDQYAVGDPVPIITGPNGIFVMVRALANENFVQGDSLVTGADGVVAEQAIAALGSQGDLVGEAWVDWNVASEEKILAKLIIVPENKAVA